MLKKSNKGFTLVELLAVIVILAIILAIAVPGITKMTDGAKKSAFMSDAKMIMTNIEYKKLECDMGAEEDSNKCPKEDDTGTDKLSNYGVKEDNYTSFKIVSLDPVEIEITSSEDSEFGSLTGSGTKATFEIAE